MHYDHFQEVGVIYSTFKYNHKIISIRRHYNLLYREATIYTMLVGQGRFSSTQLALIRVQTKLTCEVCHCHWHHRWKCKGNSNQQNDKVTLNRCWYFDRKRKTGHCLISLFWNKNILKSAFQTQFAIFKNWTISFYTSTSSLPPQLRIAKFPRKEREAKWLLYNCWAQIFSVCPF